MDENRQYRAGRFSVFLVARVADDLILDYQPIFRWLAVSSAPSLLETCLCSGTDLRFADEQFAWDSLSSPLDRGLSYDFVGAGF